MKLSDVAKIEGPAFGVVMRQIKGGISVEAFSSAESTEAANRIARFLEKFPQAWLGANDPVTTKARMIVNMFADGSPVFETSKAVFIALAGLAPKTDETISLKEFRETMITLLDGSIEFEMEHRKKNGGEGVYDLAGFELNHKPK